MSILLRDAFDDDIVARRCWSCGGCAALMTGEDDHGDVEAMLG